MRAVIIAGGSVRDYDYIKGYIKADDRIICADSGYRHAKAMGLAVDAVIGDFDSLGYVPSGEKVIVLPVKKDLTDTQSAVDYARLLGCDSFLMLACMGMRMDHTLANIFLMKDMLRRKQAACMLDERNRLYLMDRAIDIEADPGAYVSLIALSRCIGVTTQHLEYPLQDATLNVGSTRGISNVMLDSSARITLKEGLLLVSISRD